MRIQTFQVAPIGTNCYIVSDDMKNAFIIDPGGDSDLIIENAKDLNVKYLLLTHTHYDHIGALDEVSQAFPEARLAVHGLEKNALYDAAQNLSVGFGLSYEYCGKVDIELKDGDELSLGEQKIKIIHTPGHTVGGVCYYIKDLLFSGDTLFFNDNIGRMDLPFAAPDEMVFSLNKLKSLDYEILCPGHDY